MTVRAVARAPVGRNAMASSPPLVATAPAGGRAPSPSRPSLAEPPPGQPAAPESAARMWAVGQPSGPCGAGRPAWEPGSSPRVAASSPGRDVTGQLCLDRSQGRVGGTGASPQCPWFQGRRHDTTWPTVHEKVLCVSLPDTASGVEGSASSGGLALASAQGTKPTGGWVPVPWRPAPSGQAAAG